MAVLVRMVYFIVRLVSDFCSSDLFLRFDFCFHSAALILLSLFCCPYFNCWHTRPYCVPHFSSIQIKRSMGSCCNTSHIIHQKKYPSKLKPSNSHCKLSLQIKQMTFPVTNLLLVCPNLLLVCPNFPSKLRSPGWPSYGTRSSSTSDMTLMAIGVSMLINWQECGSHCRAVLNLDSDSEIDVAKHLP